MTLVPGDRLAGRYLVQRALGVGGMGSVFLALELPTGATRVLKQLRVDRPELVEAFRSEFALLSSITDPHLMRVHDFGTSHVRGESISYYVAEWIDGQTFSTFAKEASLANLTSALLDAVSGLAALHAIGVRHGDFTPGNVLVDRRGRGTLIDLGCARPFSHRSSSIAGTPGYFAPELLAEGGGDARADLFSVGVTLRRALEIAGQPPSAPLAQWIERLTATDPGRRPESAMEVLEGLGGRARGAPVALGLSRRLVGRDAETARFSRWLRDVVTGTPRPPVLMLTGTSGAGKTRLLRDWVARAELALEVIRAHAAEPSPVSWLVRQASGGRLDPASSHGMVGAAQELAQGPTRRVLVLEAADRLGAVDTLLLLAFARSIPSDGALALLVSSCEPLRDVPGESVPLGPLNLDALRAWTAGAISDGTLNDILRVTAGLPRGIESELERLARSRGAPSPPDETDQALRAWLTALEPSEIEALALLAALDGELDPQPFGVAPEAFSAALESGLVQRDRARLRLRRRQGLEALRRALPRRKLTAAHARVARALAERTPASPDARTECDVIHHAALGGLLGEAEERLRATLELFRRDPRPLIHRSAELLERTRDTTTLLLLGELALLASEPRTALSAAARLLRLRPTAELAAQTRLLGADALVRLGRARRSERILERLLEGDGVASLRASALEQLARARMQSGDHSGAERAALRALELQPSPSTRVKALETLGVAATYLGRLEDAAARFAEVSAAIDPAVQPRDACRLLGHRAILAFRAGRIADAARDHREALQLAERAGLDDLVAVCSLNLGTAEQQLGELGGALASYQRGLLVARAVGRESTELTLRFNLANLRAEIGDLHGAEQELDELTRRASSPRRELLVPSMAVLRAEIALARRDLPRAHQQIQQARAAFAERGLLREGVEADACEAELELERGDAEAAERRAGDAEAAARSLGATDVAVRAALLLARAEAARGDPHAITRLEKLRVEAAETGQQLLEARAATELHGTLRALGRPEAAEWGERARRSWDRMAATLPEALREPFWADPRRGALEQLTRVQRVTAAGNEAEALRRLLSLSRRMNSSLSLAKVLEYALDAAIELTHAERGFLLLAEEGGPRIAAARPSEAGTDSPSGSIVRRVLETEEAVLTTDAQNDERFSMHGSVHALRLKSVLCVPIGTPDRTLGALYVDSRVQRARFEATDRALLLALADQLAVALTNARLHAELEAHARELVEQKRSIEQLSRAKDRELERLREQVEVHQRALLLRYDYSQIVGRGPRMRAMLEKLDRIIDSNANVLLQGESGTGKELVARAIHANGRRTEGPFVGVNCAALPDTLLESELFGHVRGAFTGADREKKGLMLAANGGTLFLDEIGELPLATQTKLLRVIQEREVRPLGSARSLALDVRLVCATHRDLSLEISEGRFREDLFYRIAVVTLEIPPLRERLEDVPLLSQKILERLATEAGRPTPELTADAMRLLSGHAFPGNVRELENILTRAFVLASGPHIGAADLDLLVQNRRNSRTLNRRQYETEERERILAALTSARWNVSTVARQLGIPRNTLYRKLHRYGLERDPTI